MTKKIGYSKTYPILNIGVWEKIFIEEEVPVEADTRKVLYELKRQVESFHFESNKADEKKTEVTVGVIEESANEEWEEIKNKLSVIIFQEDAQDFINTTDYAMTIEAKKLIISKPLKNEKR